MCPFILFWNKISLISPIFAAKTRAIMQDLCVTATRDHNVYVIFRPSIATKDAETHSKMNSAKYKLPTPYSFWDIAWTQFYRSRSLQQGQIKVTSWCYTPTPPNQCPYQISTSYTLQFLRYSPDRILKLKVTTARSKVKSRSDHDVAHLHLLTNVPTKYQLPTPYGFGDTARTNFFRPPTHPPIRTPWVKTIPRQPLRAVG